MIEHIATGACNLGTCQAFIIVYTHHIYDFNRHLCCSTVASANFDNESSQRPKPQICVRHHIARPRACRAVATMVDYLSESILSVTSFLENDKNEVCACRTLCKRICKDLDGKAVVKIVTEEFLRDAALGEFVEEHMAYDFEKCGYVEEPDDLKTDEDYAIALRYGIGHICFQSWTFKVRASIPGGKCYSLMAKTIKRRRGDGIILSTMIIFRTPLPLFRRSQQVAWLKNMKKLWVTNYLETRPLLVVFKELGY